MTHHWLSQGHRVIGVSRSPGTAGKSFPRTVTIVDWSALTPEFFQVRRIDTIVNFAGAPMIQRWDRHSKPEILLSRQVAVERIFEVVRCLPPSRRPKSIVGVSSAAIYSTQTRAVDESLDPEFDINFFQSIVWRRLEKCMQQLRIPNVRSVIARIGVLIGPYDMMSTMLLCSRWFCGAIIGDGKQEISWISHHDLARAFDRFISDTSISGTYNVVSPQTITARQMSTEVARAVNRSVRLRIPGNLLRLTLGELAENFLTSACVKPTRLLQADFRWNFPDFRSAVGQAMWELQIADQAGAALRQHRPHITASIQEH